jgi:MFS family permease
MPGLSRIINRDFILVFLAQLAFHGVMQILVPTLPIYLKKLGSTEIDIGILVGILGLAAVVCRPLVGRALMKTGERAFMLAGATLFTVASIAYLLFPPFWPLLFVRIFHGAGSGSFHTASTTYVVNASETGSRTRVFGYFALTAYIAGAIAPPLGMLVFNKFGFVPVFLICTLLSLFMLFISSRLRRVRKQTPQNPVPEDGFLISWTALPASIVGFLTVFVWGSVTTFFPLYAMGLGITNPGLFFTAMAVMLILGRTLGGKILDYPNKRVVILPCIANSVLAFLMLALCRSQPMFILAAALWGTSHAFFIPSLMAFALDRSKSAPGSVVATFYTLSDFGMFLGPPLMGAVIHYTSYPVMFFCLALVAFISLLYFWWFTRRKGI